MSFRKTRAYKVTLWLLAVACLGGAGYLGYRTFIAPADAANRLKEAEAAYARGDDALSQKKWEEAATRFDEARLLADKASDELTAQVERKSIVPDEVPPLQGKIMWVKARAIRDRAYAKAEAESKPLPYVPDPQYNENYRNFIAVPDPTDRDAARLSLRVAGDRLGSDPEVGKEVVKEVLRSELSYNPIDWVFVEPVLQKALEHDPKNARANYYLARYKFEQPGGRRSAQGIDEARELLKAAKENGAPYWRCVGMEADMLMWPLRTAKERKLKPAAVEEAQEKADELLFGARSGAVAEASRGEKLTGLGAADAAGMVSVLQAGIERATETAKQQPGNVGRAKEVAQAAVNLTGKLADNEATQGFLVQVAPETVRVASAALPYLTKADPSAWQAISSDLDKLLARLPEAARKNADLRLNRARLLAAEADLAAAAKDAGRAKDLRGQARKELEEGLKAAEEAKAGRMVDEFHAELALLKLRTGAKAEDFAADLARLKESASPGAKLFGQYAEGRLAERQGRLEKAKQIFTEVAANGTNPDLAYQANLLLAEIHGALGEWPAARGAWKNVEAQYTQAGPDSQIRAFTDEHGGIANITANLVVTNLRAGIAEANAYAQRNPGQTVPLNTILPYEQAAEAAAKKLSPPASADRVSRIALAEYYLATKRRDKAEAKVDALALDYPDSIDLLNLRCRMLAVPEGSDGKVDKNGVGAADVLIRKFLRDYPGDKAARLFKALWLVRTDRADEAVEFLRDKANFPGGPDPAVDRLLAVALFRTGAGDEAQKVLSAQSPEPVIDLVLLEAATTKAVFEKRLKDAKAKYEDEALFRIYEAALRLYEGKYEEAVNEFASSLEFTRVRSAARAGLQRALAQYGDAEPIKARATAVRLAGDFPDEPAVYLGAALAARQLDDIGQPGDDWDLTKSMFAATKKWEEASLKAGTRPADLAVAKVQFRLLSGDIDGAKSTAATAQSRYPNDVTLMLARAELALVPPADTAEAKSWLEMARKENADDPRLPLVEAAILSAGGNGAGAAAVYEKLLERSPNNSAVLPLVVQSLDSADKKADALRWARTWVERLPQDNRAYSALIRLLTEDGKKAEAVKAADDLVAKRAEERSKIEAEAKPPRSKEEAEKAVNEAKGNALLAAARGFFQAKAYDEAEARFREVLKSFPDNSRVKMSLADIAMARKEWDKAMGIYREILKAAPRHFIAGNNLAWVLAEVKNDPKEALAIVEEVRKARGDRVVAPERLPPDFLDTIGVVYVKLNDPAKFGEMQKVFEAAAKRYPTDPRMQLYLGHALAGAGDRARAVSAFDEAIRLAGQKNSVPEDQNKAAAAAAQAAKKKIQN